MKLSDVTALGRPVDLRYPTNRAIAAIMTAAFLVIGLLTTWATGLTVAVSLFLSWALGRELDPDHNASAFAGVALTAVALTRYQNPSLALCGLFLLSIRAVNNTTGLRPKPTDWLALAGLAWLSSGRPHGFAWQPAALALTMALTFWPVYQRCHKMTSQCDNTPELLSPKRVRAGQLLSLTAATLLAGFTGLAPLAPYWAAVLGSALVHLRKPTSDDTASYSSE